MNTRGFGKVKTGGRGGKVRGRSGLTAGPAGVKVEKETNVNPWQTLTLVSAHSSDMWQGVGAHETPARGSTRVRKSATEMSMVHRCCVLLLFWGGAPFGADAQCKNFGPCDVALVPGEKFSCMDITQQNCTGYDGPKCQARKHCCTCGGGKDNAGNELQQITTCAAGKFFTAKESAAANPAKCTACGRGKFKTGENAATSCAAHKKCEATGVAVAGNATTDAVCGPAKCTAGKYFTAKESAAANPAKCTACGSGKFKAGENVATSCAAHKKCEATGVVTAGDATSDASCAQKCIFAHTANHVLGGYNEEHKTGVSVADCKVLCCARAWCTSFDYHTGSSKCDLSKANPSPALKASNSYDHYSVDRGQSECTSPGWKTVFRQTLPFAQATSKFSGAFPVGSI